MWNYTRLKNSKKQTLDINNIAIPRATNMNFLNKTPDKVEVILRWNQRSMVFHAQTDVLLEGKIVARASKKSSDISKTLNNRNIVESNINMTGGNKC